MTKKARGRQKKFIKSEKIELKEIFSSKGLINRKKISEIICLISESEEYNKCLLTNFSDDKLIKLSDAYNITYGDIRSILSIYRTGETDKEEIKNRENLMKRVLTQEAILAVKSESIIKTRNSTKKKEAEDYIVGQEYDINSHDAVYSAMWDGTHFNVQSSREDYNSDNSDEIYSSSRRNWNPKTSRNVSVAESTSILTVNQCMLETCENCKKIYKPDPGVRIKCSFCNFVPKRRDGDPTDPAATDTDATTSDMYHTGVSSGTRSTTTTTRLSDLAGVSNHRRPDAASSGSDSDNCSTFYGTKNKKYFHGIVTDASQRSSDGTASNRNIFEKGNFESNTNLKRKNRCNIEVVSKVRNARNVRNCEQTTLKLLPKCTTFHNIRSRSKVITTIPSETMLKPQKLKPTQPTIITARSSIRELFDPGTLLLADPNRESASTSITVKCNYISIGSVLMTKCIDGVTFSKDEISMNYSSVLDDVAADNPTSDHLVIPYTRISSIHIGISPAGTNPVEVNLKNMNTPNHIYYNLTDMPVIAVVTNVVSAINLISQDSDTDMEKRIGTYVGESIILLFLSNEKSLSITSIHKVLELARVKCFNNLFNIYQNYKSVFIPLALSMPFVLQFHTYITSIIVVPKTLESSRQFSGPVVELLTYERYVVTNEHAFCLTESEFLNDIIIDFYLKHFFDTSLTDDLKSKTHIFNTFFYLLLTTKATDESEMSLAEKRHHKVRRWTRNINLFEKDFIIIPINIDHHWFLSIICYPGEHTACPKPGAATTGNDIEKQIEKQEEGEEETDNREQGQPEQQQPEQQQQEVEQNNDDNKMDVDNDDDDDFVTPSRLNSTIIYPKAESVNTDNGQQDGEEKAAVEADGVGMDTEDSDVNEHITVAEPVEEAEKPAVNHPSVNHPSVIQQVTPLPGNYRRAVPVSQLLRNRCDVKTRKDGTITRPLIFVFDSLNGITSRSNVLRIIRQYLQVEWDIKMAAEHGPRDFSVMSTRIPKIPQQQNYSDCGLYLLQYVESFFQTKIMDYTCTSRTQLLNWFPQNIMKNKRKDIVELIQRVQRDLHPDREEYVPQDYEKSSI